MKVGSKWIASLRGLAAIALCLSCYLLWLSWSGREGWGCGPDSDCGTVLRTRWAYWFGVPVSLGAVTIYLGILAASFRLNSACSVTGSWHAWVALHGLAQLVLGAALWFVAIQALAIRALCPYCLTAHACGALLASMVLTRSARPLGPVVVRRLAGSSTIALAVLVAGQILHEPKTYSVRSMPAAAIVSNAASPDAVLQSGFPASADRSDQPAQTVGTPAVAQRLLSLHDGRFELDLRQVPLTGPVDAPHLLVHLFDYTCKHCRALHPHLVAAQRRYGDRLAVVHLPVPLEGACNTFVKRALIEHTNACVYARLGLAVWRVDRTRWPEFDDWLFAPERPVSPQVARERAAQAVGPEPLDAALRDPWIDHQLRLAASLNATNYYRLRQGSLPQLLIGTNLISGRLGGPDLDRFLAGQPGLEPAGR